MNKSFRPHNNIHPKESKSKYSQDHQQIRIQTLPNNSSDNYIKIKSQLISNPTTIIKKKRSHQSNLDNHNMEQLKKSTIIKPNSISHKDNDIQTIYVSDKFKTMKKSFLAKKIEDQFQSKSSDLIKTQQFFYNPQTGALNRLKTLTYGQQEINELVNRFQTYEKKRKTKMQKLKNEIGVQQNKNIKEKPTLSEKTLQISETLKNQPLYKRYDSYLEKKKTKLEQELMKKQKLQKQQQEKLKKQYQQIHKVPENIRSYEQFFQDMVRWQNKKQEKSKAKREILSKQEMTSVTFKPQINLKSKKIQQKLEKRPLHTKQLKSGPKLEQFESIRTKYQKQKLQKHKYGNK